ncbi:MAG: outer membrane protein assembly factor BamD [Planctomycetes bacterium]|nr:outer membrane protein assembly factor BamD [Planctomycetota bacterium]
MTRRPTPTATLSALLLAAACATNPGPLPIAPQVVEAGEAQVRAGDYDQALATLDQVLDQRCPKRLRDRRDLARARAEFGRGRPWQAFLILERFSDDHPLSELRPQAVELLWSVGKSLIESDGGFLFFWSDRRAGRSVLEHLITRHPDTRRLDDALRILGDLAFEDGDYELAQARYRDIILDRPDSDWRYYAQYRLAMSIVAGLRGPDYDLARMQQAARELRAFLATNPESPQMLQEAERALEQIRRWQVRRHLDVAAFYRTLDNLEGQLHHAELATSEEFRGVEGYDEALELKQRLEAARADGSPQPAQPTGGRP